MTSYKKKMLLIFIRMKLNNKIISIKLKELELLPKIIIMLIIMIKIKIEIYLNF